MNDNLDDIILELERYTQENKNDDTAFFRLGNAYRKNGDIPQAIRCYLSAVEINPQSPAKEAHKMLMDILEFRNTDLYNP
jgi:tetratricopeptide (TPR) repeat protein